MTNISILGSGNMARALAVTMLRGNNPVQILGRDGAKTRALVEGLGPGATGGIVGADLTGAIVFLAIPHKEVHTAILKAGDSLDGRVIVDISNPVDPATFDQLTVPPGTSAAEETARMLNGRAEVVKAFNTTFPGTLEAGQVGGQHLDVFIAGDSEQSKEKVSAVAAAGGLRPIDVGPLRRARELEAIMLVVMGLQVNPEHEHFNWDTALRIIP
ncbi:NADPH-dependent F420 reductase [Arthrobacter sp. HMWF013]|uniref:NADPH-dependent F420 reductase n=1 Tax=Arthrobacter sp. HMWF013 TaxID=2056849 RepID=UPI000D34DAF3|nr:NAD(P)-binding domain-containing protein [Arthrobacter sp. HMWF013]PTT65984.1 NADP oxidoreductase [Arthrobacter sp. HMWF013]